IVANGNDVASMRGQTVRVQVVNLRLLSERKDALLRFVRAYREALDWIFTDPQAMQLYAAQNKVPEHLIKQTAEQFQTRPGMQFDTASGADATMAEGVTLKFLDGRVRKGEVGEVIQIPPPGS